jgi:hypothetical protein
MNVEKTAPLGAVEKRSALFRFYDPKKLFFGFFYAKFAGLKNICIFATL